MRSVLGKRTVTITVALALVAAALVGAYALAGAAPATTRQQAPVWLDTVGTTKAGHTLLVGGGIDVKADLSGAVVKIYRRDAGTNTNTYVGQAKVTYERTSGNQFYLKVPHLRRNCLISAVWTGSAKYFGSRTWAFAAVSPKVTLSAPIATEARTRLLVEFTPLQPVHGGNLGTPEQYASIQCRIDGVWTSFPVDVGVESTDGSSYCAYNYYEVPAGTYTVRAVFKGTNSNAVVTTKAVSVTVP